MFQMKIQDKTSEKNFYETEITNLLDKEFKVIVIKMFIECWKRMDGHSENVNKEIESKRKYQI